MEALNRKLREINNLPALLVFGEYKLADSDYYFGDINNDKGISDYQNLSKDLEILEKHLRYVKELGVTSVCFFAG